MPYVIVLQQRVKNIELVNLAQFNENTGAIENLNNDFIICNNNTAAEGCYLLRDRVKGEWMQSEKDAGRPMQERLNEHETGVKLKRKSDRDNKFCRSCPLNTLGLRGK